MKKFYFFCALTICGATVLAAQNIDGNVKIRKADNRRLELLTPDKPDFRLRPAEGAVDAGQMPAAHYSDAALRVSAATDETVALLDSIVTRDVSGAITSKIIYGYDTQGRRILQWATDYADGAITGMFKYEYAYNAGGDQTLYAYSVYNTGAEQWETRNKEESEWGVDAENNKTRVFIRYSWSEEQQVLVPTYKQETTYWRNSNFYSHTSYNYIAGQWEPSSMYDQLPGDDGYDYTYAIYRWNAAENKFWGESKEGYTYSPDGNLLYQANYRWSDDAWDWVAKIVNEYHAAGTKLSEAEYAKSGDTWQPVSKTGYEGDYLVHYDIVNSEFIKTYKDRTYLRDYGLLSSYSRYDWDAETGQWCQYESKVIGCDWTGTLDDPRVYQYIEVGYDKHGNELYRIQFARYSATSPWNTAYTWKAEYTYDENGRRTTYRWYEWTGGEPYSDGVWTFDWINYRKSDYTYNEQGQQQLTVTSQWIDGAWVETSRTTYYYSDHEVTSSATVAVSDYQVKINAYPNPAQDNLAVSGTQAGQTVRITNMSGQQIGAYTASEGETHINLSTLAKGIYIVSVDDFSVKIIRE